MPTETSPFRHFAGTRLRVLLPPQTGGEDSVEPTFRSHRRRRRRLPPEVLTNEEVCALMQACGRFTPTGTPRMSIHVLKNQQSMRINLALSVLASRAILNRVC
jgi:hypothetical protein